MWLILKLYTILVDFFLLDSVRYRDDVMVTLKFDWSNLKISMSGWHRKLTSSCVLFTTYQQCHSDIEGDVTPISLKYQNIHWVPFFIQIWILRKLVVVPFLLFSNFIFLFFSFSFLLLLFLFLFLGIQTFYFFI